MPCWLKSCVPLVLSAAERWGATALRGGPLSTKWGGSTVVSREPRVGVSFSVMAKGLGNRSAVGRTAVVGLALLVGALLACRRNGPNQPGTYGAADVKNDAAAPDAADAQADAEVAPAAPLLSGKACVLGGATQTAGTQIMMFREAADFPALLAAADAGANQQQRTEQFRNSGGILVPFGTHCTMLESLSAVVKVQVTDGSWVGTQGWVPADSVAYP